jgi:D-beta-D-heptose 7-phosphate kinase/D-beta-D-heptose 1-phosphate adenosyltransferase
VDRAEISVDVDPSVCQSIVKLYVDIKSIDPKCEIIFTKGGDRFAGEIPEKALCDSLGIKIVDGLGEKTHNSSEMVKTKK